MVEGNTTPDASCPEKAVRRVFESGERKGDLFYRNPAVFILGSPGFSTETGYLCFLTYETQATAIEYSSELCPHPVDNAGSAAFYQCSN